MLKSMIDRLRGTTSLATLETTMQAAGGGGGALAAAETNAETEDTAATATPKSGAKGRKTAADEPAEDDDEDEDEAEMAAGTDAGAVRAAAAEISALCAKAGVPDLAAGLIAQGVSKKAAKLRIADAKRIKGHVAIARKFVPTIGAGLADEFIRNGSTAAEAGLKLLDMMVASQAPEIRNSHQPGSRPAGAAADDHGWGARIDKATGRKEG
jgi:hypothetical protein